MKTIIKALTGNGAAAYAMKQINPDVVAAYPITPSTQIMEDFSMYHANGLVDSDLIRVESEHSAMSACVGASAAGARVMTATSSQGLGYMFEVLPVVSGLRLPIVVNIVNRSLSAPLNIHCDHGDSMSARDLGWIQIYAEDAQEVYINNLLAIRLAEKVKLPIMLMQDGFITSHCVIGVDVLDDATVKKFVGNYNPEKTLLKDDITIGTLALTDYYFEFRLQQIKAMNEAKKEFIKIDNELNKIIKHSTGYFEEYKLKDAKAAIVVMSSTAGAVKEVINDLRSKGKKVGLLKLRLFRPFPYEEIKKALKGKKVIVMDRSISLGANCPLYSEIKNSGVSNIHSIIFGLGGKNIYDEDIKDIFERALKNKLKEIEYIGVRE
ncbi:MAG: pyruvate ferredoxin oxidoreductase [Nanoarchaeota archaeon]|nr:pyruvate ferredoxin oxidoreductase [Nanoarchaeota archaeon]MBU0963035.1 pyruvate ferredoxin oxidoreductase [Nanoarchaeota archaeon]